MTLWEIEQRSLATPITLCQQKVTVLYQPTMTHLSVTIWPMRGVFIPALMWLKKTGDIVTPFIAPTMVAMLGLAVEQQLL